MNNHANLVAHGLAPRTAMPDDTRGIIDPGEMMRWVEFDRTRAGAELEGLIEWFWSVSWDLPDGVTHDQRVLSLPAGNISIGTIDDRGVPLRRAEGQVYGVVTRLGHRHLSAAGWNIAARTTVGGLGVLLDAPATSATDARLDLATALPGLRSDAILDMVRTADDNPSRIAVLRTALEELVDLRKPSVVAEARNVATLAALAERDRSVCRVEQLAAAAGTSVRTLQRLFGTHVGVSPSFVIRRWRIIEAAEAARTAFGGGHNWQGWAAVAADLGYADQAHLTRDFRRHLGMSPSAYLTGATRPEP